jgi:trimethylamine:corrinoid methyltransferase-like protein
MACRWPGHFPYTDFFPTPSAAFMKQPDEPPGRRNRRRATGAEVSHAVFDRTRTYRHLRNPFEPLKVFSDDQVSAIHDAALVMLETQGMKVLSSDARKAYRDAGGDVDEATQTVRLGRDLVAASLRSAPRDITLHAVDPQRHVPLSDRCVAFGPTSGPPNIMDTARGRRAGTFEDFCNITKLCQSFEVIHFLGGATEPQDIAVNVRHLHVTRAQLMLCDKIPFIFSRGHGQIADNFELIRLAHGITPEEFRSRPYTYTIINTNSPLQLDIPMAEGIMDFAAAGQVLVITLHARGRHGAGDDRGCPDARARRGSRRPHPCSNSETRSAYRLRQLHVERRYEIRIAGFRHAGIREGGFRRGPDGAISRSALAILERDGFEHPRCAVGL